MFLHYRHGCVELTPAYWVRPVMVADRTTWGVHFVAPLGDAWEYRAAMAEAAATEATNGLGLGVRPTVSRDPSRKARE